MVELKLAVIRDTEDLQVVIKEVLAHEEPLQPRGGEEWFWTHVLVHTLLPSLTA